MSKMTAERLAEKWIFVEIHLNNDEMVAAFIPHHHFKSLQMDLDREKGYTLTFVHEYEGKLIEGQLIFNTKNMVYMRAYRRGTRVFDEQALIVEGLPDEGLSVVD